MPVGKTIECSMRNNEGPGGANSWAFFLFWVVGHLQAGYRLLIAVQPFVDEVANHTNHDSDEKR